MDSREVLSIVNAYLKILRQKLEEIAGLSSEKNPEFPGIIEKLGIEATVLNLSEVIEAMNAAEAEFMKMKLSLPRTKEFELMVERIIDAKIGELPVAGNAASLQS